LGIAVVDQGVSAATNVSVTIVAARSLSAEDFGVFGVLFLVYLIAIGAVRALVGEPALVRLPHPAGWRGDVLGSGLLISLLAAGAVAVGGGILLEEHRTAVVLLVVLLPLMVLQDLGRYIAFAERRPAHALRLDLTWAVAQTLALSAVVVGGGHLSLVAVVGAWSLGGAVGGVHALRRNHWSRPHLSSRWVRASWEYSWRYLSTFATTAGIAQVTAIALGGVAGVTAVGALRAVQVLFGPLNVLFTGVVAALVPEAAQPEHAEAAARHRLVGISAGLAVLAGGVVVGGLVVPSWVGHAALGDTWPAARDLLVPVGLVAACGAAISGADIGLRAARAVRESLGVQLRLAPAQLVVPIAGALVADVAGYAWALAGVSGVGAVMWWRALGQFERAGVRA
jgi:O-antigen/teichoic acid export membrane protein